MKLIIQIISIISLSLKCNILFNTSFIVENIWFRNKFIKYLKIKNQIILNHRMANTEVEDNCPVHHNPMPKQHDSVYNMVITKFWPDQCYVWAAMMK